MQKGSQSNKINIKDCILPKEYILGIVIFRIHEEPIVCSLEDAIRIYKQGYVDIMDMEDIVI